MRAYPVFYLTQEMIDEAKKLIPSTKVNRTVASNIDTLTGHLGEFIFAKWFYGDWRNNSVGKNKGKTDFPGVEIKTSSFPFSEKLNLLVREDYAEKRKPEFYVQLIIDTKNETEIEALTKVFVCGFATSDEVMKAPLKDFGSKLSDKGGYQCRYISIGKLKPMKDFKKEYAKKFS